MAIEPEKNHKPEVEKNKKANGNGKGDRNYRPNPRLRGKRPGAQPPSCSRNFIWIAVVLLLFVILSYFYNPTKPAIKTVSISQISQDVNAGNATKVEIKNDTQVTATLKDGTQVSSTLRQGDSLKDYNITPDKTEIDVTYDSSGAIWATILQTFLPALIIVGLIIYMFRAMSGANMKAMSFGQSKAKLANMSKVRFKDVAGLKEAKTELMEEVEFLRNPTKFLNLGAEIPKGVLLVGPPGTGKTLLAKAVAGEAGVPFYSISASEFVEMFVGVGASVTGDTPVLVKTPTGTMLVNIGDFVDTYYPDGKEGYPIAIQDVQTLGFQEKQSKFTGSPKKFFGGSQFVNVGNVYRHKVSEIYEIKYLGGTIRTTGDHSVFIRDRNGIHAVETRNLKKGDILVNLPFKTRNAFSHILGTTHSVRQHQFAAAAEQELIVYEGNPQTEAAFEYALANQGTMSQKAIASNVGVSQATVGNWQNLVYSPRSLSRAYSHISLPEKVKITPALMKLLGYYTAEGRSNNCLEFVFNITEKPLHEDVITTMRDIFKVEPRLERTTDNTMRIIYAPAELGRFFARLCGTGSHNKHIPSMLWELPREHFLAYLKGYSLGDGYVTKDAKLCCTSVSYQLIKELSWLCAMHGIKCGIREMALTSGRIIKNKPLPAGTAWNLIIGKTSNPLAEGTVEHPNQGKKPIVQEVIAKPYDGYVYDLCGCDNEAFFGGEKPVLLHNSRVRDLFTKAKKTSPCIIFIDELDAIGRQRGAGLGGGHDEREQTLNQILVEMDGFDTDQGVIVMAATNRPDVLDQALLRPGRFDRRVIIDLPTRKERLEVLQVYANRKPLAPNINLDHIAGQTAGMSPADLKNIMNEAAILTARAELKEISQDMLHEAVEKVLLGPERPGRVLNEHEKKVTAVHEAGHAIVGHVLPNTDDVQKVSIISRGMALGLTWTLPKEDRMLITEAKFQDELAMLLSGRLSELIYFNEATTGAGNDLKRATNIARQMITDYGMSEKMGLRTYGEKHDQVFLGRNIGEARDYSEDIALQIDNEVARLLKDAEEKSKTVLHKYKNALDHLTDLLMEKETVSGSELTDILQTDTGILKENPQKDAL